VNFFPKTALSAGIALRLRLQLHDGTRQDDGTGGGSRSDFAQTGSQRRHHGAGPMGAQAGRRERSLLASGTQDDLPPVITLAQILRCGVHIMPSPNWPPSLDQSRFHGFNIFISPDRHLGRELVPPLKHLKCRRKFLYDSREPARPCPVSNLLR
jgi:hypothetical protein